MAFRPSDLHCLRVVVSPLISVYDRGRELERHLSASRLEPMLTEARSTNEFKQMVRKEIEDFGVGIPWRLLFIDEENGVETDPEWATSPILLIAHYSPDGDFLTTPQ